MLTCSLEFSFDLTQRVGTVREGGSMGACCSEEHEDLLDVTLDVLDLLADDVEADGLGEGAALADGHDITGSDTEGGGAVDGDGVMALLESVVFLDVMKVIASDDDRPVHFSRDDNTLEDSAADGHVARERALLVDVGALNGGLRGLEAEANFFVESNASGRLLGHHFSGGKEDAVLLLEGFLGLKISHLWYECSRK
eukprot:CAMPEP_0185603400 /NCGR_PEP_ID=MMETSP0436-20130131/2437_1 /TAXON_ID=626734 ORGANISM="Favella taraikaensis, Strain Fe Narragansett Bay" /NCGR_SAMPLE_ID=MMETSP0436 /ASSEMBLY_ACC=CAM_ASM_000390 /LENGTH=196 /DNA_ID=CAMNT_0028233863 /DNA_START=245 /DNA_END=835 /DNA_ORIENTATION=-